MEEPCLYNPSKPSGYYMYHLLYPSKTLHSATEFLYVLYGFHNKQRPFPYTALTCLSL
jgi:hypothetical protein